MKATHLLHDRQDRISFYTSSRCICSCKSRSQMWIRHTDWIVSMPRGLFLLGFPHRFEQYLVRSFVAWKDWRRRQQTNTQLAARQTKRPGAMSQLNDETLRKVCHTVVRTRHTSRYLTFEICQILAQIQATAQISQRNLAVTKSQIQQKEKDRRILQLTIAEIGELPRSEDIKLYKGVGKM